MAGHWILANLDPSSYTTAKKEDIENQFRAAFSGSLVSGDDIRSTKAFEGLVNSTRENTADYIQAATGFAGMVDRPTVFLTGEAGKEYVSVTPMASSMRPRSAQVEPLTQAQPRIKAVADSTFEPIPVVVKEGGEAVVTDMSKVEMLLEMLVEEVKKKPKGRANPMASHIANADI